MKITDDELDSILQTLRHNRVFADALSSYIMARINTVKSQVIVPLINEREADTLRGRIAELQKLLDAIQNDGEIV